MTTEFNEEWAKKIQIEVRSTKNAVDRIEQNLFGGYWMYEDNKMSFEDMIKTLNDAVKRIEERLDVVSSLEKKMYEHENRLQVLEANYLSMTRVLTILVAFIGLGIVFSLVMAGFIGYLAVG